MARTATQTRAWQPADLRNVQLDEGADGFHRSWIMLLPEGRYEHPEYGQLDFSRRVLSEIKTNFDRGVRGIEIALDYDHRAPQSNDTRAPGWIERVELGETINRPAGLWAYVRWTSIGLADVREQIYRYISAEYRPDYTNDMTGETYRNVLVGCTLTNRPFMKVMPAIELSERQAVSLMMTLFEAVREAVELAEVSRRSWGDVNKSQLPASCFLIVGDPAHPTTWRLPVYEGAGPMKDGRYTRRGPLNINGVRAALQALGGSRTGKAMTGVPSSVRAKLQHWMEQFGASAQEGKKDMAGKRKMADRANEREDFADPENEDAEEYGELERQARMRKDPDDDGDDDTTPGGDTDHDMMAEVDPKSDRHSRMTTDGHSHGRYARHSHDGDADHSDAPLKRGRKLSEPSPEVRTLTEQLQQMQRRLHEQDVSARLAEWGARSFTLSEKHEGKLVKRDGRVALSKAFRDAYREFALSDGFTMGEARFAKVNALIELLLSDGLVDLTTRSAGSFEMHERETFALADAGDEVALSKRLAERSREIALSEHKRELRELDTDTVMRIQRQAAREIGYHKVRPRQ